MAASSWAQVPKPLQRLFDRFPLLTYDATALPERSRPATDDTLPTLYTFTTSEEASLGHPSFNPSCLKWQTLLRLSKVPVRILPSTNHASPTGTLPFLLPPRSVSQTPIPASKLTDYIRTHGSPLHPAPVTPRLDAYQALIDLPIRNAWLYIVYLHSGGRADGWYIEPASKDRLIRYALRNGLREAAASEILKGTGMLSLELEDLDLEVLEKRGQEALEALAELLRESETGWFFDAEEPGVFDASVFAYTYLLSRHVSDRDISGTVKTAAGGTLDKHRIRMLEMAWPGWDEEKL
ncbi:hypothetical protein B0T25DRAFT_126624 [Lasiosphaeria hispida]|uniref:Thioredoxin-like fold domain-containing protein n=1 Tax=Lasiosphaeria hispida TaxID=260671 RepID=A0AAJ0MIH6_9PEZI|nr:hypothetical protein B0T25DRAFT_126624 [Lasiosphaeria hispida]